MLLMPNPSLALNDQRVGGHFNLRSSLLIYKTISRQGIVNSVANFAGTCPEGKIKSLVLNCHGLPGYLVMGEGFWGPHTGLFQAWRGKVDTIWITACRIASRKPETKSAKSGDGFTFCQQIAMSAQCTVVASQDYQEVPDRDIPEGYIDSFEGQLLTWRPDGSVASARRYDLNTRD